MEFGFNLNEIFKSNTITKVNYTLLPEGFSGDRRKALHVASQVADVVDSMGLASAKAQDLHHPITSAEKMKNCDHTLYLMIDPRGNDGKGSLVGLLKMGVKHLFLFDATGMVHEKETLCVLDFYVHETKQRTGLGKQIFDFMLEDKDVVPCKLAIDKPSQNFLKFLNKHYGLAKIYPQNNNFVLFEGFFDEKIDASSSLESLEKHEAQIEREVHDRLQSASDRREREDYLPHLYGRHTAFKPHDTMGTCLAWLSPTHMNHHSALW